MSVKEWFELERTAKYLTIQTNYIKFNLQLYALQKLYYNWHTHKSI